VRCDDGEGLSAGGRRRPHGHLASDAGAGTAVTAARARQQRLESRRISTVANGGLCENGLSR